MKRIRTVLGMVATVTAASASFGGLACRTATDNNQPCTLVKAGPDGGAIALTEKELRAAVGFSKDFLTAGSAECEDGYCARDSAFVSAAGDNEPAQGYCTTHCRVGSPCFSSDERLDRAPSTALTCRAQLLDETTLAELCRVPSNCEKIGNVQSPYFCARGTGARDGGK